jgi:hypothetical protein
MILVNPTVGVAPGTTTMTIGGLATQATFGECAPDPVRQYTSPLHVRSGNGIAITSMENITPSLGGLAESSTMYMPYTEIERLRGLGALGVVAPPRWGLILFAGLATFAAVLFLRRRRR